MQIHTYIHTIIKMVLLIFWLMKWRFNFITLMNERHKFQSRLHMPNTVPLQLFKAGYATDVTYIQYFIWRAGKWSSLTHKTVITLVNMKTHSKCVSRADKNLTNPKYFMFGSGICPMHCRRFPVVDFRLAHFSSEPFIYIFIINSATHLIIPSINSCFCLT